MKAYYLGMGLGPLSWKPEIWPSSGFFAAERLTVTIAVLPHSPITSVTGLRGKTIGVNALANVATLIVSCVPAENGVPPSSVTFVAIPFPQLGEALEGRRIPGRSLSAAGFR